MRITIEHEGRAVQYNFQDGEVVEVSMHRNEDGSTRDFTFAIKGVHLWSKIDCRPETRWTLDEREEEA